jgi:MoaA/NifB/PqqE/SkfB family radical SAM enzyme
MAMDDYRQVIDQISDYTWWLLLYFQGESFINPSIIDMINYAYQKKIFTVISSNGNRLANPEFAEELAASQLGQLILSVDGATEETYRIYRQAGYFQQVIKGIRQLLDYRKNMNKKFPRIHLQFLVMRHNEHEISKIKKLGRELGVDRVILKSPQIHDFNQAEEVLPLNPKYRRYFKANGQYQLKGSYSGYCKKIWYGSVITWDQKVLACCFDKNADFPLGDLKQKTFKSIWSDQIYHDFRWGVVNNRNGNAMCRNCTEGLKIFFR